MWSFQYKHGDRPLEGYTIQRAAGRGGFGEVYYAVSDSGREVALKVVTGYEQIELRGISQCMNLKSPHLVTIFDVRYNDQGRPFVIMEYVAGPSLRQLLDESPAGLGTQKAAFFLREIGKGLTFLHECGIVHRDLKPGNIFYENGYVKIGDYGLSKAISPTQHSGQTVTVGTVHYMAPEVGAGKYDRSIDIYALGVVLYEMLTGTPPHLGASPSEILLKHLSAEPDCTNVPEPFATVIKKAMAKSPADRYQSVQEMIEAVFGAEHVRMSVSCFSPEELSVVAGRVAEKMRGGAPRSPGAPVGTSSVVGPPPIPGTGRRRGDPLTRMGDAIERMGERIDTVGRRIEDRYRGRGKSGGAGGAGAFGASAFGSPTAPAGDISPAAADLLDPLPRRNRWILATISSLVVALAATLFTASRGQPFHVPLFAPVFVFATIWGGSIGFMLGLSRLLPTMEYESKWGRRVVLTSCTAAGAFLVGGLPFLAMGERSNSIGTWAGMLLSVMLTETSKLYAPRRRERISFGALVTAAIMAWIFCAMFSGNSMLAVATAVGIALMVQILSPWIPAGVAIPEPQPPFDPYAAPPTPPTAGFAPAPAPAPGTPEYAAAMQAGRFNWGDPPAAVASSDASSSTADPLRPIWRPVPKLARAAWIFLLMAFTTAGLLCVVAIKTGALNQSEEIAGGTAAAFALLTGAVVALYRTSCKRYYGPWSYFARPLLALAFASSIFTSVVVLKMADTRPDDRVVGAFFIIFPSMLLIGLAFTPRQLFGPTPAAAVTASGEVSPYNRRLAAVFCVFWFCGVGGVQRLYVGRIGSGLLYLFTGGLFGIGQLIDLISIVTGRFRDAQGRPVLISDDEDRRVMSPPPPVPPIGANAPAATAPDRLQAMIRQAKDAAGRAATAAQAGQAAVARVAGDRARAAAYQAHAAMDALKWQGRDVPSAAVVDLRSLRRQLDLSYRPYRRGIFSAIASGLGGLFVFLSLALTLGLLFQLELALADGLPKPYVNTELTRWFGYAEWPTLMHNAGTFVALKLGLIGTALMLFGRRRGGWPHMIRALLGTAGLFAALAVLGADFKGALVWAKVADAVQQHQNGQAIATMLEPFQTPAPYVAGGIALVSIVLLSWPERRNDAPVRMPQMAAAIPVQMPFPPQAPQAPNAPQAPGAVSPPPPQARPLTPPEPSAAPNGSVAVAVAVGVDRDRAPEPQGVQR